MTQIDGPEKLFEDRGETSEARGAPLSERRPVLRLFNISDLVVPRAYALGTAAFVALGLGGAALWKIKGLADAAGAVYDPPELPLATITQGLKRGSEPFIVTNKPSTGLHPVPRTVVSTEAFVHHVGKVILTNRFGKPVERWLFRLSASEEQDVARQADPTGFTVFVHAPIAQNMPLQATSSDAAVRHASSTLPSPEFPSEGGYKKMRLVIPVLGTSATNGFYYFVPDGVVLPVVNIFPVDQ